MPAYVYIDEDLKDFVSMTLDQLRLLTEEELQYVLDDARNKKKKYEEEEKKMKPIEVVFQGKTFLIPTRCQKGYWKEERFLYLDDVKPFLPTVTVFTLNGEIIAFGTYKNEVVLPKEYMLEFGKELKLTLIVMFTFLKEMRKEAIVEYAKTN